MARQHQPWQAGCGGTGVRTQQSRSFSDSSAQLLVRLASAAGAPWSQNTAKSLRLVRQCPISAHPLQISMSRIWAGVQSCLRPDQSEHVQH